MIEIARALRDGFYEIDKQIINSVHARFPLSICGSGISSGIRILRFADCGPDVTANAIVTYLRETYPNEVFVS